MRTLTAALLLLAGTAQAGVIYNWQTIGGSERELVGRLEFSEEAYRLGRVEYDNQPPAGCPLECSEELADPDSPVISFHFRAVGARDIGGVILNYRIGQVAIADMNGSHYYVALGNTLSGLTQQYPGDAGIFGSGGNNLLEMFADGDVWSMRYFNFATDWNPCRLEDDGEQCIGVTGRWVLDQATVPEPASAAFVQPLQTVPVPGTLALLALGVAGIGMRKINPSRAPSR